MYLCRAVFCQNKYVFSSLRGLYFSHSSFFVPKGRWRLKYKAEIMDESAVMRALKRVSHEILEKNGGCGEICIVGIKRRGVSVANIIADNIEQIEGTRPPVGELDIKLYRDDLSKMADDPVVSDKQSLFDVTDKTVVLADDVIYTGRTVRAALDAVMKFGRPAKIQLAVLVDRGHRELPIKGDFVGKNVPTSKQERVAVKIPPFESETSVELYE